jgi:hypothetical protein
MAGLLSQAASRRGFNAGCVIREDVSGRYTKEAVNLGLADRTRFAGMQKDNAFSRSSSPAQRDWKWDKERARQPSASQKRSLWMHGAAFISKLAV